jgi:hypothetical protein
MEAMGRLSDPIFYEALQHFITDSPWEASPIWAHLRACVPVRGGLLALDDPGFPKQGTKSVGVQRQYCGALGKIGNGLRSPALCRRGHSGAGALPREMAHRPGARAHRPPGPAWQAVTWDTGTTAR